MILIGRLPFVLRAESNLAANQRKVNEEMTRLRKAIENSGDEALW